MRKPFQKKKMDVDSVRITYIAPLVIVNGPTTM